MKTEGPAQARQERPAGAHYDELRDAAGNLRPHWQPLSDSLTRMGPAEFARRRVAAQAMLQDNGVTYNVYDEHGGLARRWQLDIVPFVVGPADWARIEAGVAQRAQLVDALLRDLYGPQKLIAEGHLPRHVVLGHPQFLRPLTGLQPAHGVHVHLYSADLARLPDGSWVVLASRADAPSGIGYALENRIVVGQTFPDLFADMKVQRLASFFGGYRECVQSLARTRKDRVVLLTPGPHNEAYFEHAFLAYYLGLTLVEGDDLAVRDGQVYLKTLTGLERVGVIFRRVDSDFCDPLELRGDSALGVPGLLDAVRAGSVVLANALGGGVVESPAMDAYLPGVARALLGEELKIPDIPTVWCGTEWGRKEALSRLDRVIVRGAFDARPLFSRTSSARLGSELSSAEIQQLKDLLSRRGATIVTQDAIPLGQAPSFEDGKFRSRSVSLRVFAAWTPHGYQVMPGGLVRVASEDNLRSLSLQSGALSKDAWVPSEQPVDTFSLLREAGKPVEILRTGEAPPSRAMDNLFWLGRYSERAENLVRVLRAIVLRRGEGAEEIQDLAVRLLPEPAAANVSTSGDDSGCEDSRLLRELKALIYGRSTPHGLQRLLARVRQTAWSARDRLSLDTWRTLHLLTEGDELRPQDAAFDPAEAQSYLDALIRRVAAFSGLCAENMTRGPNWLFTDLGRRIERGSHLAWLLRQIVATSSVAESDRVRLALEIADSAMTYRSRYLNNFQLPPLIDLLLLDDSNPRSLAFQFAAIEKNLKELPRITPAQRSDAALKLVVEVWRGATDTAFLRGASGEEPQFASLLDRIDDDMFRITDAITDAYFQHAMRHRTGNTNPEWS